MGLTGHIRLLKHVFRGNPEKRLEFEKASDILFLSGVRLGGNRSAHRTGWRFVSGG